MPRVLQDLPALPNDRPGIFPLLTYNPVNLSRYPAERWATVWALGWSIFRAKIHSPESEDGWDYAFVELRGQYAPMYDFCGGMLVSSLSAHVYPVLARLKSGNTRGPWFRPETLRWRQDYTPIRVWRDTPLDRHGYPVATMQGYPDYADVVPEAGPFIGDEPRSVEELRSIGERSIAAWLIWRAHSGNRRCIFGADRVALSSAQSRRIVRTGSLAPSVRAFSNPPAVEFSAVNENNTRPTYAAVSDRTFGSPHSLYAVGRCAYHPGTGHRNANSGSRVSVYTLITPAMDASVDRTRSSLEDALALREEWAKLTTDKFLRMIPNHPFHNG